MTELILTEKHAKILRLVKEQPVIENNSKFLRRFVKTDKALATELAKCGYLLPMKTNNPEGRFFFITHKGREVIDPYMNSRSMKAHGKFHVSKSEAETEELRKKEAVKKAERKARKEK